MKKKLHYPHVLFLTVVTAAVTLAACTANEESTKDKTKNSEASLKINSTSSSSDICISPFHLELADSFNSYQSLRSLEFL